MKSRVWFFAAALGCALSATLSANDWPQWRGPHRDDLSAETGLLKAWPARGPNLLWTIDQAGIGYAGPAIVGDRLYTMGAHDGNEYVYALDANTGKQLWSTSIGPLFVNDWGDGPRGTPTVDNGLVYGIGAQGVLYCVDAATGKDHWQVNLKQDLGGKMMSGWGYTESPLDGHFTSF